MLSARLNIYLLLFLSVILIYTGTASAIQCYECHGEISSQDYRPVDSPYRNITTGGFQGNHRTHMVPGATPATCAKCHPGSDKYRTDHRDGNIKISSSINNSPSPLKSVYKNSTSAFPQSSTPALGKCGNVNCHFEKETPIWGSDPSILTCSSCHGTPPAGTLNHAGSAGSHPRHDQYFTGLSKCIYCHPNNTTYAHATSVGRNLIVNPRYIGDSQIGSYNGPLNDYIPANRPGRVFGTCSDFYCHSDGTSVNTGLPQTFTTAAWGTAITCSACHGFPPAYTNQTPKANSHPRHNDYGFTCNKCHAATTSTGKTITNLSNHVNKFYNISGGAGVKFRYTYSINGGTCTANTCHHDGTSIATGIPNSPYSATWGSTVSCTSCHLSPPNYTSGSPKANNHPRHQSLGYTCNNCHASTTADGTTISGSANHANGFYNISGGAGVYLRYTFYANGGVCSSNTCHHDGTIVATGVNRSPRTAKWGTAIKCDYCHAARPDYPNGSPKANNHQSIYHRQGCVTCHSATVSNNTTLLPGTTVHANGAYNIVAGGGLPSFNYTYSPTGGSCSNVLCHGYASGGRKWSATADKCDGCHDCPPDTPSHRIHYSGNATQANYSSTGAASEGVGGYLFNCGNCHPRDINSWHREGTVQVELYDPNAPPGSIKAKPENINAAYTPGSTVYTDSRGYNYTNGTCDNVYCHSYNKWTTPGGTLTTTRVYKSATWGGTLPKDCTGCHDNPPKTYMGENSGGAGDSHYHKLTEPYNTTYNFWEQGHSNKLWFRDNDPVSCKACHNDTVKQTSKWSREKVSTPRFTIYSGVPIYSYAKHVNGKVDVAFDRTGQYKFSWFDNFYQVQMTVYKNLTSASYASPTKTCSNVSCHRMQTSVQWGTTYKGYSSPRSQDFSPCNSCHADKPRHGAP